MLQKMFKGPNRILKIVSAVLVIAAVIGCLIWSLVETANVKSMETEIEQHYIKYSDTFYATLLQNWLLIIIGSVLGVLIIALTIMWLKTMVRKASSVLKIVIIVQAFILLAVILIWCITDTIEIIEVYSELLNTSKDTLLDNGKIGTAISDIHNMQTEAIITHVLATVICTVGVAIVTLVLHSMVDGAERIVISLEKIAENAAITKSNKYQEIHCACDEKETDCHTSVSTGSQ